MARDWTQNELIKQFEIENAKQSDEIEKLRWENSNMEKLWGKSERTWMEIRDKQEATIWTLSKETADEIDRLRKALQFYSDQKNYEYKIGNFNVMSNVEYNEIGLDNGDIARAALNGDE